MATMRFMGLTDQQTEMLELEVVSRICRNRLTRMIRDRPDRDDSTMYLIQLNRCINVANNVLGRPVYVLDSDEFYEPVEFAWHFGEAELLMVRPSTTQLAEILGDLLQERLLNVDEVNEILATDGLSFSYTAEEPVHEGFAVSIQVLGDVSSLDDELESDHPNIRALVGRMERALSAKDASGVLHSSASIFETLAKDIVGNPNVEDQPLGSFFALYRKSSRLPTKVLDYIHDVYGRRGAEPLAGHGNTKKPSISIEDAVTLCEFTKSIVRVERQLQTIEH